MAVYIPPSANTKQALDVLLAAINNVQTAYPYGIFIIAGYFNQANLKTVLPKFHQHITCPTRGHDVLDHVYSNIKDGYKVTTLPYLGQSDHLSLFLTPAYTPLIRITKPSVFTIRTWHEEAFVQLQDHFEHNHWDLFAQQNIEDYTFTVLSYLQFCVDNVTVEKQITSYPNNKQWMTQEVKLCLRDRHTAFRSGNVELYSTARSNLKRSIKEAKAAYRQEVEGHFSNGDPRRVWQGIQHLTNYKRSTSPDINSTSN